MSQMRIVQVVPKEIEVVFSIPLETIRNLTIALDVSEFSLDRLIPKEDEAFSDILEFHELLKNLIKGLDND